MARDPEPSAFDARARLFWDHQLAGELPVLDLPLDRLRGAVPRATDRVACPGARPVLDAIAARHAVAVEAAALAAYAVLLHRYASQDELVVGLAATDGARPLRIQLGGRPAGRPTFSELIAEVAVLVADAHAHAGYPVDALLAPLRGEREPGSAPMFQAMFALHAPDADRAPGAAGAAFDLRLDAVPTAGGLEVALAYDAALFDRPTIDRIADAFGCLLAAIAEDPDRRVIDLPLLTAAERAQVVVGWNATARDFPRDRLLHDYVADQARRQPDAPAVEHDDRTLSYRELDAKANALALRLQALGVTADVPVGLYLERSLELIVSILAVLKAGGAYLPLDPTYPSDRLAGMLADARVTVVVALPVHGELLRGKHAGAVLIDPRPFVTAPGVAEPPACPALPANLAYIIYTSGSTGRPKGVMLPHVAVSNFFSWVLATYDLGPGDRCLHVISPSFDVSVWEIFTALCAGATLVISRHQDPPTVARLVRDRRVTFATFLPSVIESLTGEPVFAECTTLRTITTGAEALSVAVQDAYLALGHGALFTTGGTTETAVASTHWRCVTGAHRVVPYGRPIANTAVYLLDENFDPVPIGVRGEMYIAGAGCARGFARRPALSAERFVPDPFGGAPGARMYRTGDFARWLPDGSLEFLGRLDSQVKVRGFRIELGEIGSVLAQHPEIRDSVVLARGATSLDRRLVGYVVGIAGRPDPQALRGWLKARLPDYMVPSAFVVLDAMPHLPNGKLDRHALPEPGSSAAYVAPRTAEEDQLAAIWRPLLKLERIGADDHFFELGGHSLMATQLISRVRDAFGVELPLRAVFEQPTIAGLAGAITSARGGVRGVPAPPLVPVARDRPLALSFAQQRLWFLDQYEADSPFYNEPVTLRLRGPLDVDALEASLAHVIARHEALRTTFAVTGGEPSQVIHDAFAPGIPAIDLQGLPAEAREAEAVRQAIAWARRPFDLARGPVLRLARFTLGPDDSLLLIVMHHIVGDDWSLTVFWNELVEGYRAITSGEPAALAPLAIQYADFAAWQRAWLSGAELARQLGYWTTQLAGAPALIDLPTDRPRPPLASHRGAAHAFALDPAVAARLAALGRALAATPFMILLAGFQALLHRYTRQDDLVTGTVVANRNRAETEGLIGFFVNTLVCRTDLSGAPTFRELVGRVREVALGAYDHQDVPFEKIVEALHPERALGHAPLFQVMFVLQNAPQARTLPGIAQQLADVDIEIAKFDLTLFMEEGAGGLRGRFVYRTDLFDAATIARMADHLARLLAAVASDPEQPIAALPLIGAAERAQLAAWTATAAAYPGDATLAALFEGEVARAPDAIAVELGDARLTYAELDHRANQLAHHLGRLGVGPDVLVGLCMERSLELVVGLVGILKAGGAYLPLDPGYPAERLAVMMADARAPVVITQRALAGQLPAHGARVVCLDADAAAIAAEPSARLPSTATATDLAYVDFTSGSTGRPKGVCVPHRAVARLVRNTSYLAIQPDDVLLQMSPIAFDASTLEVWGALLNGAKLVILPPHAPSLAALGRIIVERAISVLWLTAPLFHQMVDHQLADLAGVRVLLAGGDVLSVAHVERAVAALPGTVVNGYGPTENTTFTACYPVPRQHDPRGASVPIGRPIANTTAYVVDPAGELAPIGVPGELYTGGAGLARGYLNRPALTAEKFVPDRFGAEAAGRLYRTGDLVRWRADGTLEFLGRIDQQVKIRGFRIELGEIEAVIGQDAEVRAVAAVVREDAPGDKRIVAYVVGAAEPGELRARLAARLPAYMLPSAIVALDALPLTATGKLDRKALLGHRPITERRGDHVAPRTASEREVARIFEALLGVPAVGAGDSFFALGGHSLLATRIISRVRDALGVELPLRSLFEAPTVAAFAAAIDARAAAAPGLTAPPIVARPPDAEPPLSFAQQRMWFLDQLEPGSPFYNVPQAVRLDGPLDPGALARSLTALAARHAALRTTFPTRDGQPVQVIAPAAELPLTVIALDVLDPAARDAELQRLALADARRPFDLARGPLVRATLVRLADHDHALLLAFHHIICDGWSIEVVWRELAAIYGGLAAGAEPALPPLAIQYADFAAWQRRWLSGPALAAQLAYWRHQLRGSPGRLELPTDRPRPPVMTYRGALYTFAIPAQVTAGLEALARREAATLFMTLLAAFHALLGRHSGQTDILVGTPVANRSRGETEGVIGLFVNTLVLRGDLAGDPSFRDLLARVRDAALGAYGHQDVPFEKLVEELRPERSLGHAPLFQVMFDLTRAGTTAALPGLAATPIELDGGIAKFDLSLAMADRAPGGGLGASFEYATDLYDESTIARMADHFQHLLAAIVADPARPISRLDLLGADERRRVVAGHNASARAYPAAGRIHERFARHAAAEPARIAVTCEGRSLTYGELDARANQLARHLHGLGAGPETLVGIAIERSLDLAVALLGVLKTGAAYVPLDPDYPRDRLAYMIDDARPRVVLVHDHLRAAMPTGDVPVLAIDTGWPQIARHAATPLAVASAPDSLIYVIYTSGSTGRPKGVMNRHAGAENHLDWLTEELGFEPGDHLLHKTPLSFDSSALELFLPLVTGARLVLARPGGHQDIAYLIEVIRAEAITMLQFVPSMLGVFVEAKQLERCTSLRRVLVGGEALPGGAAARLRARLPSTALYNLYGQTEASDDTSAWRCGADEPAVVPIGRPIANVRMYVVDRHLAPAPIGVAGEIVVGGTGVARGYLARPALTAERFVPDPFATTPGGRLYRTGDLGRVRGDGVVEFAGRIDHQVKLRGFRIELGEIEAELARQPGVHEVVVIVRDAAPAGPQLVAYIVGEAAIAGLRAALSARLPAHMVPSAFVRLAALPLTPNEKLDRRALPAPEVELAAAYVAPRSRSELAVARIFGALLGLPEVSAQADFFAAGGHSLLAVQLFAALEAELGVELPLATVFRAPTVEALAREVDARPAASDSPLIALRPAGTRAPLVCVHPIGGSVLCYQPLIARLAPDRPCDGLEARGLVTGDPATRIVDMAAAYTRALLAARPAGPFHLLGWSFGGSVALEIAHLLTAAGHTVASTTLIDAYAPGAAGGPPPGPNAVLALFAQDLGLALPAGALDGLAADAAIARVAELAHAAGVLPPHAGADVLARRVRVLTANLAAEDHHVPHATAGRVVLIRAREANGLDPAPGWRPFVRELAVVDAPGSHFSMVQPPNAAELARLVDGILADADA